MLLQWSCAAKDTSSRCGAVLQDKYGNVENLLAQANGNIDVGSNAGQSLTELVVTLPLPMSEGQPLVKDWDCLRVRFCTCSK